MLVIKITDPYYEEDVVGNVEEIRIITGDSKREILKKALVSGLQSEYETLKGGMKI